MPERPGTDRRVVGCFAQRYLAPFLNPRSPVFVLSRDHRLMCGIIGFVGREDCRKPLLAGLRRLEYRGYDSAGLAVLDRGALQLRRTVGRVQKLDERLANDPISGKLGIAHTRWATHGRPTQSNAHPHVDATGTIAIVHNGIIENHSAIRCFLEGHGISFASETDSECLAQLIGFFHDQTGDLLESVRSALRDVSGTFGLALISSHMPNMLIAARRGSPLIVGMGSGDYLVASDANALVGHAAQVTYLEDNEIVTLSADGMSATTIDASPVEKKFDMLELTLEEIDLGGYEHHMLKEIFEQPESLRTAMRGRLNHQADEIVLGGLAECTNDLARCKRALLFGCGTAWHAALTGKYIFEDIAQIPTQVDYASELRYRNPILEEDTLAIAISQSGETADTLAALREVQIKGARTLGIVNVVGSTVARQTDAGVYLHVGAEIGVASTKAFTAQVAVLAMLATYLGRRRHLAHEKTTAILDELEEIPHKVDQILTSNLQIKELAQRLVDRDNWLYLGRGVNYPVALEGSLKLKEISYIHAEGLPAAEMKHGPIAMIDAGMPVVVIAPRDHSYNKILANIAEVHSRGGCVIAVANELDSELKRLADEVITIPATLPILSPLLTTVPLQLLAYHVAVLRGHDVDKPRNLAKSVTVE